MKPRAGYHLPAMASVRLFVYGSLKRGGRHHDEWLQGATFLGEAETLAGYQLEPLGEYLALIAAPGSTAVVSGELFEVAASKISVLDAFEGDAYMRATVPLRKFGLALAYLKKAR